MKRILAVGILVLTVALVVSLPVLANSDGSIGTCPPGFDDVHVAHEGGGHDDGGHPEGHKHVGNDNDENGDGLICVKKVGKDDNTHVHADNNYRRGQRP